ncbi:MAG: glycosyltransferase family 4 protein, partial [Bacteroidales bacterium]
MKTIALVGNTAWGMFNFRGKLIEALVNIGFKVLVIAPFDKEFSSKIEHLGANFIPIGIDAKGTNPLNDIRLLLHLKRVYKSNKVDFIFHYTIKPNIYGGFAARLCNIPHIAVTTGLGYTFVNNNWISKISKQLYKYSFRFAKEVWFLNNDDKTEFLKYKIVTPLKAKVIKGEGIDLNRFTLDSTNTIDPPRFLLIARMLWDKGIQEFIKAAEIIHQDYPNAQFQLLGFVGVDNPSAISQTQIDEWVSKGIVNYLGGTNDVRPFIQKASCVVLPSYREGIPFTLLEACALGKPIITTNSVGCREVIEDNTTGFMCEIKNVESLANAMLKIIHLSPEEYIKMG